MGLDTRILLGIGGGRGVGFGQWGVCSDARESSAPRALECTLWARRPLVLEGWGSSMAYPWRYGEGEGLRHKSASFG